jgi:quinol monooxygenase YgiN
MSTPPAFVVLTVYTSSPEHRQEFVSLMQDFVSTQALLQPGLETFDIFTDEGTTHIITLARWRDRTAFEGYKRSKGGIRASEMALVLKPTVYFLHPEATVSEKEARLQRVG